MSDLSTVRAAASHASWERTPDRAARTLPGRESFLSRFVTDEERRAYFARLSRKGVRARREQARRAREEAAP